MGIIMHGWSLKIKNSVKQVHGRTGIGSSLQNLGV
jgi:hypothetical protein